MFRALPQAHVVTRLSVGASSCIGPLPFGIEPYTLRTKCSHVFLHQLAGLAYSAVIGLAMSSSSLHLPHARRRRVWPCGGGSWGSNVNLAGGCGCGTAQECSRSARACPPYQHRGALVLSVRTSQGEAVLGRARHFVPASGSACPEVVHRIRSTPSRGCTAKHWK